MSDGGASTRIIAVVYAISRLLTHQLLQEQDHERGSQTTARLKLCVLNESAHIRTFN